MMNRKLVDEMAVEFCMTLNTKLHRKKLAKALYNVEKNRCDATSEVAVVPLWVWPIYP
jgi:hypothetical protein